MCIFIAINSWIFRSQFIPVAGPANAYRLPVLSALFILIVAVLQSLFATFCVALGAVVLTFFGLAASRKAQLDRKTREDPLNPPGAHL